MSVPPLTPQERDVAIALSGGRPKRYLHVYAMMGLGALFLGIAGYKALTRSDSTLRVAERPGPKATAQEPSVSALKELIEKQSAGSTADRTSNPSATREPGTLSGPLAPSVQPALSMSQGSSGDATGKVPPPPVPLDFGQRLGPSAPFGGSADRSAELDRKLVEASYMTAKTDVYVQSTPSSLGGNSARVADSDQDLVATVMKQVSAATKGGASTDPLTKLTDSGEFKRLTSGGRANAEERITARAREQENFAAASARASKEPIRSTEIPDYLFVAEGTMIPAVLARPVSTYLPGQIEARVTGDVFDSAGKGRVMIPKGSRITGVYNANVAIGQERLQAAFTRIIFPSGASIALENAAGVDRIGNAGMPGEVNNHFARIFGSALAVGLLTYAVERRVARDAANPSSGTAVNVYGGSGSAPGTVAAQTFANVTNQILDRNLSIGPTLAVPAGTRINVQVARDLAIDPGKVL